MKQALIVDDSGTTRWFYRETLEGAAFSVEEAVNGIEGLEKAARHGFDLLIVDVNMPGMDGYAFMAAVRSGTSARAAPAIMISTEAGEADREKAWAAGANFYLVKPVKPEELVEIASLMADLESVSRSAA
jgi:two-component system chemotaxis response regulator CheY